MVDQISIYIKLDNGGGTIFLFIKGKIQIILTDKVTLFNQVMFLNKRFAIFKNSTIKTTVSL